MTTVPSCWYLQLKLIRFRKLLLLCPRKVGNPDGTRSVCACRPHNFPVADRCIVARFISLTWFIAKLINRPSTDHHKRINANTAILTRPDTRGPEGQIYKMICVTGPPVIPLLGSSVALKLGSTLPHLVFENLGKIYGKIIGKITSTRHASSAS